MKQVKVRFVLVHGAGHGAWCWYKLKLLLQRAGHNVTCIDLAGAGRSPLDPNTILNFNDYNKPLITFLSHLPPSQKVILVGHSAGGLSVTHACIEMPDRIAAAVYVAATMLPSGFTCLKDVDMGVPKLGEKEYECSGEMPPRSIGFKKEEVKEVLYQECSDEDIELAKTMLRRMPMLALQSAVFEGRSSEDLRRVYIKTMNDRVLSPDQQEDMIAAWPPKQVFSMESDHSPFFSAPLHLSLILLKIATSYSQEL